MNPLSTLMARFSGEAAAEIDPVCGMSVEPAKAAGSHDYLGKKYFFCAKHCVAAFKTDPAKYTGKAEKASH